MIRLGGWLLGLALALSGPAWAQDAFPARFVAGEHYRVLSEPAPAVDSKVEVLEFFLYSCPHCRAFEPTFADWAAAAPEGAAVRRVPVTFGAAGPVYARLFYTARELDVLERLHGEVFAAIHERGQRLTDRSAIREFFVAHGVDGEAFDAAFVSEAVERSVAEAERLMRAYGVMSVPSIGIDGRYWVTAPMAGSQEAMLSVAEHLIARERDPR